jgi:hypothetical protein
MQLGPNLVPACISVADTSQMSFLGVGRAGHTEAVKAEYRFTKGFMTLAILLLIRTLDVL